MLTGLCKLIDEMPQLVVLETHELMDIGETERSMAGWERGNR